MAGLDDKSAVRIAGVRVGKVDGIRLLPDGTAVARLVFDGDVELRDGAWGQVKNLGLLGDKYVDLFAGDPMKPRLPAGARIPGRVPVEFDELTKLASEIGKDVKELTGALSGSLGGETGEAKINRIVDNVGALAEQLKNLVEANRQNVDVTMANLREFSSSIRETLARLDRILDENRSGVKGSVANIEDLSGKLKISADNLNSITGKIDSGRGDDRQAPQRRGDAQEPQRGAHVDEDRRRGAPHDADPDQPDRARPRLLRRVRDPDRRVEGRLPDRRDAAREQVLPLRG